MKTTPIELPDELVSVVRRLAGESNRSEAEVVREALAQYIELSKRPLPKLVGMGSDANVRAADSEEWLLNHWNPE